MLRYQLFLSYLIALCVLWSSAKQPQHKQTIASFLSVSSSTADVLIDLAPLWVIIGLALYGIGSIALAMLTFASCPAALAELENDVKEAKVQLTKLGIQLS
uniref:Dolichol-phosphate mannosyltransferase subunit 3 n=1 Tax=Ditylum brightwellii TaxID=49249 RepID=A0A7S4QH85_9STRA